MILRGCCLKGRLDQASPQYCSAALQVMPSSKAFDPSVFLMRLHQVGRGTLLAVGILWWNRG